MSQKVPDERLQGLFDSLRLLELLTTETKPFDRIADLANHVRWYGYSPKRLRGALKWVKEQARRQRTGLRRNDCDTVPERTYPLFDGVWIADSFEKKAAVKRYRKEARKAHRKNSVAHAAANHPARLEDTHPWLFNIKEDASDPIS